MKKHSFLFSDVFPQTNDVTTLGRDLLSSVYCNAVTFKCIATVILQGVLQNTGAAPFPVADPEVISDPE